jgi:hypothetical protein
MYHSKFLIFIEDEETDEWFTDKERDSSKANSPFTKEFTDTENEVFIQSESSKPDNLLFNLDFITFLQSNFMPYIFIWGGYVFRDLDAVDKYGYQITHLTQGSLEKHFGTIKKDHGHTAMYPAQYANEIVSSIITSCQVVKPIIKKAKKIKSEYFFNILSTSFYY